MSPGNTLQEKFILAPSFRGTDSHDGEGMAEHLPGWQEPEVAAHPFWSIGKLRKDCRWSWPLSIKALLYGMVSGR